MSVRASTPSPRICSGAIVYDVPRRVPTTVSPPSPASGCSSFAMPKSSSLTTRLPPHRGDEDVAGLQIAVDDAQVVRRLQRRAHRLENLQHLARRETAALGQDRPQVDALEQLHHVERAPVGQIVELEDVDDARVLDHVDGARFLHEARDHLRRRRELPAQHLDRGAPAQDAVLRLVDGTAAAGGELLLQDVGAAQRPRLQRVGVDRLVHPGRRTGWVRAPWSCRNLQVSATRLCVPPTNRKPQPIRDIGGFAYKHLGHDRLTLSPGSPVLRRRSQRGPGARARNAG